MPKFHFYLVRRDDREHIGSIELPKQGDVIPAGLKLTAKILAAIVRQHPEENGLLVQSVDADGAIVYSFEVSPEPKRGDSPSRHLH